MYDFLCFCLLGYRFATTATEPKTTTHLLRRTANIFFALQYPFISTGCSIQTGLIEPLHAWLLAF